MNPEKMANRIDFIREAIETVVTTDRPSTVEGRKEHKETLTSCDANNYERLVSLLNLLKNFFHIFPENLSSIDKKRLTHRYLNSEQLPPDLQKQFILQEKTGRGGESRIYLLKNKNKEQPSYVLKVFRPSPKKETLQETAAFLREDYEYIKNIYQAIPHIIPEEKIRVVDDPLYPKRKKAIAVVRPYINEPLQDLLTVNREKLLTSTPRLKDDIGKFCQITINHEKKEKETIDLLGKNNIVIAGEGDDERLVLLDPHIIFSTDETKKDIHGILFEQKKPRLQEKIDRLKSIYNTLKKNNNCNDD